MGAHKDRDNMPRRGRQWGNHVHKWDTKLQERRDSAGLKLSLRLKHNLNNQPMRRQERKSNQEED